MKSKVLVVDDEENMVRTLRTILEEEGYEVKGAFSGEEALKILTGEEMDLVISDLRMPGIDGLKLLHYLRQKYPSVPVIMLTAYGTVENAVKAMKEGAYDYLTKPIRPEELLMVVKRALHIRGLEEENRALKAELEGKFGWRNLVGKSLGIQKVISLIKQVAASGVSVLIQGESGTGKELVAKAIHYCSPRSKYRLVVVNCGALPENLLESELFGYEKGAFTGATSQKKGLFEVADRGTIFFDEIGDLSPSVQMKLLRVLQEGEFLRVGGTEPVQVDVRVIAATNKNLKEITDKGEFREDLYFRLNVVTINIPPLRERKEDIPLLINYFLKKYQETPPTKKISPQVLEILEAYDWPGNVRELENVIQRVITLEEGDTILPRDIPEEIRDYKSRAISELPFQKARAEFERRYILRALEESGGNVSLASRRVGLSRRHFYEKMRLYGITSRGVK